MKTSAIVSYQLKNDVISYITSLAKKMKFSRGKAVEYLVRRIHKLEEKNALLKAYFAMAKDEQFLRNQILESESDLLAELKHNPDLK